MILQPLGWQANHYTYSHYQTSKSHCAQNTAHPPTPNLVDIVTSTLHRNESTWGSFTLHSVAAWCSLVRLRNKTRISRWAAATDVVAMAPKMMHMVEADTRIHWQAVDRNHPFSHWHWYIMESRTGPTFPGKNKSQLFGNQTRLHKAGWSANNEEMLNNLHWVSGYACLLQ